jgi:protein O-mannosyl-transferase
VFRVMNVFHSLAFYLVKLVIPSDLRTLYPVMLKKTYSLEFVASALLVLSVCFAIWVFRKKYPELTVSWLYYLVTIAPVIGIIQVGTHAAADRNTYLPLLGPTILLSALIITMLSKRRIVLTLTIIGISSFLAYGTYHQVGTWKNSVTLWEHVLKVQPRNASVVYANLGDAYKETGRLDEALALFEIALKIGPPTTIYYDGRGDTLLRKGLLDDSIRDFDSSITLDPTNYSPNHHLAQAYLRKGLYQDALAKVRESIRINPKDAEVHNTTGIIYSALAKYDESIAAFKMALSLEPYGYNSDYLRNLIDAQMKVVASQKKTKKEKHR